MNNKQSNKSSIWPIIFIISIITLVIVAVTDSNETAKKESARQTKMLEKHRDHVRNVLSIHRPNLLESGVYIGESITAKQITIVHDIIVNQGYKCSTISSARRLMLTNGFKLSCNDRRYSYDAEDVGGTWIVTAK